MNKSRIKINLAGFTALLVYIAFISWRLFFYAYVGNHRVEMPGISYNLVPLRTIINYLQSSGQIGFTIWIYNLAGNVVAFMPLGFLLPIAFRGFRAYKTYAVAFILILAAEVTQLVSRRGVFDVDDLILNMFGSILCYGTYMVMLKIFNSRR